MSSEITKHHVIESILDNESITDGLEDVYAQHIIQWCLGRVEAFPQDAEALAEYNRRLVQQARTVTKIAVHIQDGDDLNLIKRRLRRLTTDLAKQQAFMGLLDNQLPLNEYIHALLMISDGVI